MLVEFHHAVDGNGIGGRAELLPHTHVINISSRCLYGLGLLFEGGKVCGEFWGAAEMVEWREGGLTEGLAICESSLSAIDEVVEGC